MLQLTALFSQTMLMQRSEHTPTLSGHNPSYRKNNSPPAKRHQTYVITNLSL